ncbi:MAG: response regulator transcription factor, partial [Saprospiraceae bacterium]|nr:response regulator transcription factor [Saprospiraceae bacterium]
EIHCTETLREKLRLYCPSVEILSVYNDPVAASHDLKTISADVLFLDIEMPKMNGIQMLENLGKYPADVVFTTAYDQYALQAFKLSAFAYLLKPIDKEELIQCVERLESKQTNGINDKQMQILMQHIQKQNSIELAKIALPSMESLEFVYIKEIVRIEGNGNYSNVIHKDGHKTLVTKMLKDFEEMLTPYHFIRIHNSHIINSQYIKKYIRSDGGQIEMENGDILDVSRRMKTDFLKNLGFK